MRTAVKVLTVLRRSSVSSGYPAFPPNADLVIVAPYDTAASGTGNFGSTSVVQRSFLTLGQKYRIRQNGTITRVRLYAASVTDLTGMYITVWRKDGSTYDLVGESNNIAGSLVAGNFATIDLSTPIAGVQEGDFYGFRMTWGKSSPSGLNLFGRTSQTGVTTYIYAGQAAATDFAWESQSAGAGSVVPVELYMQAPQAVFIGDSIMMGATAHTSFLSTTLETGMSTTIEYHLSQLTGYTYQNMGIGAQTTTQMLARFSADVVALKPKLVVINGGVNDIVGGAVTKATFLSNWEDMLDAVQAEASIDAVVVLKILPWTNGTNGQMQTRDAWNADLVTLASGYSKAVVVDASSRVGQTRASGDPGNLWDIKTEYDDDGVHFLSAGYEQIAQAIAQALLSS